MPDPNPCELFQCLTIKEPLAHCERVMKCPHAWARRSREDRAQRDASDAERKARA